MAEVQCSSKASLRRGKSSRGGGFSSKCASLMRQQRARLYILRRCATMLLCYYIHGDD